jgi:hypothetical protein
MILSSLGVQTSVNFENVDLDKIENVDPVIQRKFVRADMLVEGARGAVECPLEEDQSVEEAASDLSCSMVLICSDLGANPKVYITESMRNRAGQR